jgi:polysaccharide biosynthesis protein PslJ
MPMEAARRAIAAVNVPRSTHDHTAALWLLQAFVWLLTLLPARLIIGPIGAFGTPAALVGVAIFGLWASGAARPGLLVRTVYPVRIAVLAMWIPGLISYAVMHLNSAPGDEVNAADRWLLFMLVWSGVALLAAEGLRDASEVKRLLRVVVAGAAVSASVALVQSRIGFDATAWLARIPGLSVNGELQSVLERVGRRRPAGTATHPLELGTMLAMTLGPALALALHDRDWPKPRRVLALCIIALVVPISLSRSAVISTLIVCLFWFAAAKWKARVRGLAVMAAFGCVLFVTSPGLLGVFRQLFEGFRNDSSVSTRTSDYAAVASSLRQSPWIGRGPATFLPKFRVLDNQWLQSLIEIGILGVLGLLVYCLAVGWLGASLRRTSSDQLDRALGVAFMGSSAVTIWAFATFDFYSFQMTAAFAALFLGISGGLYGASREELSCPAATRAPGLMPPSPR